MLRRILWMMSAVFLVGVVIGAVYLVWAGSIDSSQGPDNVASRMYTLKNIYDYLTDVDSAPPAKSVSATFVEPTAGPGATMNTTDNIFENLTRFSATGQTTSYVAGDDGDLQMGATKRYGDFAHSDKMPDGTAIPGGVVYDYNTGLMWEQKTDDATIHDKDTEYTWADAFAVFIAGVNTEVFAGYEDWRLPNVYELYSICKLENTIGAPYIDITYFPNTKSDYYWSSTMYPVDPNCALGMSFASGGATQGTRTHSNHVRAVRGGIDPD